MNGISFISSRTMHSMRRGFFIGVSAFVLLFGTHSVAHAETTVWDFTNGQGASNWETQDITMTPTPEGLLFKGNGSIARPLSISHRVDAVTIEFDSRTAGEQTFAWHALHTDASRFLLLPFSINDKGAQSLDITFDKIPQWDPWADIIGFKLNAPNGIIIKSITWSGWTTEEKMVEAWKSFWTPDSIKGYSINFLWGPLIVFDSISRDKLFDNLPPDGWSANRIFYAVFALLAIGIFGFWLTKKLRHDPLPAGKALRLFLLCCLPVWILFEGRMGYESLRNNILDLHYYPFSQPGHRTFRNLLNFHDSLELSVPTLTSVKQYVMIVPPQTPLPKMALERTYPQSLPTIDPQAYSGATVFFVFRRNDISVNANGNIVDDAQKILSRPGEILQRFDDSSFLFRVR